MPKSIYFTDEQYKKIVEAARRCGYRVQRGRGSQIAKFVVDSAEEKRPDNTAKSSDGRTAQ